MDGRPASTMPLAVGMAELPVVTLRGMGKWGNYWRDVCAPRLLAKKRELGRGMPEREIAAAVEAATGKPSERSLVWMWLHGEREPFVSQFFALCDKMGVPPNQLLAPMEKSAEVRKRTPLRHVDSAGSELRKRSLAKSRK